MSTTRALLVGRRRGRAVGLVVGFAGVVALVLVAAFVAESVGATTAAALTDRLLPPLVFYAPGPLAAAGAYARCGGPACLTVGVVPAVVLGGFVLVGTVVGVPGVNGGNPALGDVTVSFAAIGLSSAFVGYCAGVTAVLAADMLGFGGHGSGGETDGGEGDADEP
ncbi:MULTISPECIES: hypothetical protein [Halorubrum]|uniref:Uncharacterized protein n=2 Tax=Halorubrum ezzemoulense TaxID=337243 RepID=A0A256JA73_HALEZ|nr:MULTISPECIES: hypothetical protein [Halorubrum]MDB2270300.1 hypothetical protein [Halorubrum ezzemoulense]MDB2273710.1 hypothetical protein [Halorubrum ezzemoulense]MDB2283191.1 hypothetical protein [Halorubrum ezzemoulense]OSP04861.1 hypothetical protein B9H04_09850 [Halorubrum ezzemoulense DSM 17463]OYR65671.1 hypothetical protein DJ80_01420 [Halorubrum ezzemoulense]